MEDDGIILDNGPSGSGSNGACKEHMCIKRQKNREKIFVIQR